ncbi:MAG TPA: GldG family protein [Gammaproteobacteria bacterium]|nr:GldG family protein [Gammaproteobacteria bacterium]
MRVTRKSRLQIRLQNLIFYVLFLSLIGIAAWLSTQYVYQADWTYGDRNSLTPASVKLLKTLDKPLQFTAFVRGNPGTREALTRFVDRYKAAKSDTTLTFVNPDTDPQAARDQGITANGELLIRYDGRTDKTTQVNETVVSNAIQRLARSTTRYVVFLQGDGERDPHGQHNFDLGDFGKQLAEKGIKVETVNLAATPSIPNNTSVLVIAGPQTNLLPGSVRLITDYVQHGGNLLWLGDPGKLYGLEPLASALGIQFGKGTIVDPDSRLLGINDPTVVLVAKYQSDSLITRGFNAATLFARATSISDAVKTNKIDWQDTPFLKTLPRSWLETGKLEGSISFDAKQGDQQGPLTIGMTLTREVKPTSGKKAAAAKPLEQRVVVIGDGDFLSNAFLNNGGNLDLGLNVFNWLAHDDSYLNINPESAPDRTLTLSSTATAMISVGFLFALPLGLIAFGFTFWIRRRRR